MQNNFTRELVLKIVSCTLFENTNLKGNKLYFTQDFLHEQRAFMHSNNLNNQWLRVNVVQALFTLEREKRDLLQDFYIDHLSILKNLISFNSNGIKPSDQYTKEVLDSALERFYNDEVIDGILIDSICTKLEDLTAIHDEYLVKMYIEKHDFDDLIEFYLS